MVKLYQQQFDYPYHWRTTTQSIWLKYPNPYATQVVTIDTLSRSVDPETGVLRTERVMGCRQGMPRWIMRMLGATEDAFVREVIFVDPVSQVTSMFSVNLSLSQYVQCLELVSYTPSLTSTPTLPSTTFTQRAHISSPPAAHPDLSYYRPSFVSTPPSRSVTRILRSVGGKLEDSGVERFGMNAESGKRGFEGVLRGFVEGRERWERENGVVGKRDET